MSAIPIIWIIHGLGWGLFFLIGLTIGLLIGIGSVIPNSKRL